MMKPIKHKLSGSILLAALIALVPVLYGQGTINLWTMTETTTFSPADILYIVINPGTSPASRKITTANLLKRPRSCEVVFGNPNSTVPLADGDDAPVTCGNVGGSDATITAVACYADAGTPSVNPVLTGGTGTSILSSPLLCGAGTWAAGAVSGTPVIRSFSTNGATCPVTPCTVNTNIQTAGGTAKYAVVRFTISQ